jgi:elongation factor 1 alpha-like protein
MSIHRVKHISYEYGEHHDYADGYDEEGEDELAPEDKEQLKAGTAAVREELGADFPASEKEIQDALWHYYYDVRKSVAYLKKRKTPSAQAKQAKQKQASRFDNAANAAASKAQAGNSNGTSTLSYPSGAPRLLRCLSVWKRRCCCRRLPYS